MRPATLHLSRILPLVAVLAAMGARAQTNVAGASPQPFPPMPPHWYQTVGHGVTVSNLTPVAYFRGLLGMTPAERERLLAGQPTARRTQVLAKVREYEALPREVREERMRQTDLHWHLLNLLPLDPASRQERLKDISPLYMPMILSQLAQWDQLPAPLRHALLEKESFLRTYVQWRGHSPEAQADVLGQLPAERRADWEKEWNRWQELSESRREELCQAFRQFFYLSGEERRETVQALSGTERRQMEEALQSYANLPPSLQRQCVDSFSKFAEMSTDDRSQFLQNAAKWEAMTASEREVWRKLVNHLPPTPPGMYQSKFPPGPPGFPAFPAPPAAGKPGVTDNGQG
jgi:hypothetical protein